MNPTRRTCFKLTTTGIGASSIAALGFSPSKALAEVRAFKLARTSETRNTCPYCSVGCGIILYGIGDRAKNARSEILHVEGDPDHPVNRGTLCPKEAALLDFVRSPDRLRYPEYRAPGATEWPGQMNYWQNYPKFFISLLKAWYGAAATKENDFAYHSLPKNDKTYDILAVARLMSQGQVNLFLHPVSEPSPVS
jgi:predicted molibdopterin-dependent oxidoreductase YjgC